jgi:hypothetical protein
MATVSPEDRFWSKVDKRGPDECWEWRGHRSHDGYGRVKIKGKIFTASRAVLFLTRGEPIPPGTYACHSCDNPPCCNPAHLWLGTNRDNQLDARRKGRSFSAKRTHCKHGHVLDEDNTYRRPDRANWRECRACRNAAVRAYSQRRSA